MNKILLYGSILSLLGAGITIYSLTVTNNQIKKDIEAQRLHYAAQIEILKHPKERLNEQKEVIKIAYTDQKGAPVIVEKVITKVIKESEPVVLNNNLSRYSGPLFLLSGAAKYNIETNQWSYDVDFGIRIYTSLYIGPTIRFDNTSIKDVGVSATIQF